MASNLFSVNKAQEKNLCDVGHILEHDGYKSMLCQEKTLALSKGCGLKGRPNAQTIRA